MKGFGILGWLVAAALLGALAFNNRQAERTFAGTARVIDGDSLRVGDTEVRLFGIDAFEGRQRCTRDGNPWPCGEAAASELRKMTAGRTIECRQQDTDSYGRAVSICSNGTVDVAAELARAGLALAYRQFSDDYVDEETEAQNARRGAWAGEFTAPWDARRGRGEQPTPETNENDDGGDCEGTGIKGNVSRSGERIYHTRESRDYDNTRIDKTAGERWFCTEQEAQAAGWRAPRR